MLPLEQILGWYRSVRNTTLQIPSNPMERVLYALLHMSKLEASPAAVIWLFYALESLLQTRSGENFNSLVGRLCLLLNANDKNAAILRKKIRSL